MQQTIDHILLQNPDWTVGAVRRDAVFLNQSKKVLKATSGISDATNAI